MALRCVTLRGKSVEAGSLTDDEWNRLRGVPIRDRNLTLPCCAAKAVFKTSPRGTRYFAHHRRGACSWKHETEAHRLLKIAAVGAARDAGWTARTEAAGTTPEGERWMTDVLAMKDGMNIAIEIEWHRKSSEELWRRQRQFRQSGVNALWLLRQPGSPISPDLCAACIGGGADEEGGFQILIPGALNKSAAERRFPGRWKQAMKPGNFFRGLFEGRFLFGLRPGIKTRLGIRAPWLECPHCEKTTRIAMHLAAQIGPHSFWTRLDLADEVPRLRERIRDAVADHPDIGDVRWHHDEKSGERFTANWCAHCGGLIDRLDEHSAYGSEEEPVAWVELKLDDEALTALEGEAETWAIWDRDEADLFGACRTP